MSDEDRDLSASMAMFEAAVHAHAVELHLPTVKNIFVAPDGSNQDESTQILGQLLGQRTGAAVHIEVGLSSAQQIMQNGAKHSADLLVIPAPFGRDFEVLRDESLGSVVDMLLQESTCPVMCVRQPMRLDELLPGALDDVLVPMLSHDENPAAAAAWAIKILGVSGRLELLGVADRDLLEEARMILGDAIDPAALQSEALNRAVTADIGGLVAAVQRMGREAGIAVHVEVAQGKPIEVVTQMANVRPKLTVVSSNRDHTSIAYHHAVDLLLNLRGPVLIVL